MELNCIRLLVKDFDACFRFYTEKLGLKVTWGALGDAYASFDIGLPSGLSIFKSDLMAEVVGNTKLGLPENAREKMAIILKVDNVDKTFDELSEKNVHFIDQPANMGNWGIRVVHLRDPEDNLIEIWSELTDEEG